MGLWPFEPERPAHALIPKVAQDFLRESLEMKEHALLSTPYLSFPGRVCALNAGEIHITTALSGEAAHRTLGGHPLRLRLPWRLSMVSGPVTLKGHVQDGRRRELILSRPPWLAQDEQRRDLRCELLGRSTFTLTREDLKQARGVIENLSASGAGVFFPDPGDAALIVPGALFEMGLRLDQGPADLRLNVRVIRGDFPRFGLAFADPCPPPEAQRLKAWLTPRLEESIRRWENRNAIRAEAMAAAAARAVSAEEEGVLIVGSQLFGEEVSAALEGLGPISVGRPAVASLKPLLTPPPQVVVMQVPDGHLEERYRLRSLWQAMNLDCPLILLGTGRPGSAQELSHELRAAGAMQWDPARARFFLRMVQGLIRKA